MIPLLSSAKLQVDKWSVSMSVDSATWCFHVLPLHFQSLMDEEAWPPSRIIGLRGSGGAGVDARKSEEATASFASMLVTPLTGA